MAFIRILDIYHGTNLWMFGFRILFPNQKALPVGNAFWLKHRASNIVSFFDVDPDE